MGLRSAISDNILSKKSLGGKAVIYSYLVTSCITFFVANCISAWSNHAYDLRLVEVNVS